MRVSLPYLTYVTRPDGTGYYTDPPPPPTHPRCTKWEWSEPEPWVDEFGMWHPGFGAWVGHVIQPERRAVAV